MTTDRATIAIAFSYDAREHARAARIAAETANGPVGAWALTLLPVAVVLLPALVFESLAARAAFVTLVSLGVLGLRRLLAENERAGWRGRAARRGLPAMFEVRLAAGQLLLRGPDADATWPLHEVGVARRGDGLLLRLQTGTLWIPNGAVGDAGALPALAAAIEAAAPRPAARSAEAEDGVEGPTVRVARTAGDVLIGLGEHFWGPLGCLALWAAPSFLGMSVFAAARFGAGVAGACFLLVGALFAWGVRQSVARIGGEEIELVVAERGVRVRWRDGVWEAPWSRVAGLRRRSRWMVVRLLGLPYVIPRRAFPDDAAYRAFGDALAAGISGRSSGGGAGS